MFRLVDSFCNGYHGCCATTDPRRKSPGNQFSWKTNLQPRDVQGAILMILIKQHLVLFSHNQCLGAETESQKNYKRTNRWFSTLIPWCLLSFFSSPLFLVFSREDFLHCSSTFCILSTIIPSCQLSFSRFSFIFFFSRKNFLQCRSSVLFFPS